MSAPIPANDATIAELTAALASVGIALGAEQVALLDQYRSALWRWNEQLNLTRHTTIEKFVGRDVVDSWQLAKLIPPGRKVLDVGSGGGVPGLVMAIIRPDLRIAVCESTQKKARVLQAIIDELRLPVEAFGCRAEELLALRTFDVLVARAVAPLAKILTWLQPHWGAFDELLLVKGRSWAEERDDARRRGLMKGVVLAAAAEYEMAGVEPPAHSVVLRVSRSARNAG
ncbi:MAG TPA: 16S rRNA (guanine(527)-N(7))-methyltransferase RsmG [Lacipirellulaceae bacterium]|nr:16S rRNA (guanine(527)-N(7))-methyltransferase RsmG [Lacipirellulaceae bacterium]